MQDHSIIFSKISRALKSLDEETTTKIRQIESREYGSNIVDDLKLTDYSKFFDETINYFKTHVANKNYLPELKKNLSELFDFDITGLIKKRPVSLLGFFNNYIQYGVGSQRKFIETFLDTLKLLKSKIENILYWMSIQNW